MHIILTNDDGIWALGLRSLYQELRAAGHLVTVIAPLTEQSAVGHAVTLSLPLRIKKVNDGDFQGYGISGTPVDCVKIALGTVFDIDPDLLISGINSGANVGVDVLYSGTVAAATEAALAGVPALAVSIDNFQPQELADQAKFAARFASQQNWQELPQRRVLNLNFPAGPWQDCQGLKICPQTQAVYQDWYEKRVDPRGGEYYWLCGEIPPQALEPGSDRDLLSQGYMTLTPLTFDFTDWELLKNMQTKENPNIQITNFK
ncbi:MAG: 5'/3'-nucleotidase SurE [Desulfohalobiaceae bacterium]